MQTSYSLLYKVAQNLVSIRNYHFVYSILCGTFKVRYCGILQWKYSIVICLENNKMMNDLLQYCVSITMLYNLLVIQHGWYMTKIEDNRKYLIA